MKLSSSNKILAENKILILYLLNKLNKSITNSSLYKLVLSITDMNFFYFQQFLLDLIDNKYVITYKDEETLYKISKKGQETLIITENLIPGILKLKIDNTFKSTLNTIEEEVSISADFIPENKNEYSVKCKIVENNKVIFEIKTFAGSIEQAKHISENWKSNANSLYPKLLKILSE